MTHLPWRVRESRRQLRIHQLTGNEPTGDSAVIISVALSKTSASADGWRVYIHARAIKNTLEQFPGPGAGLLTGNFRQRVGLDHEFRLGIEPRAHFRKPETLMSTGQRASMIHWYDPAYP